MERQKKIIDASIIVKWFSEEENTKEALEIRKAHINGEITVVIPELAFIEVLNALKYKKKDFSQLKESIKHLSRLELHVEDIGLFLLENFELLGFFQNSLRELCKKNQLCKVLFRKSSRNFCQI